MNAVRLHKELTGTVIRAKMQKTVVVEVRAHVAHKRYGKILLRRQKFSVHDGHEVAHVGDVVRIRQCRPLSRMKRWSVASVIRSSEIKDEAKRAAPPKSKPRAQKGGTS